MVSINPFSWVRKWPIKIIIREVRGGQIRLDYDQGARVKNKAKVDEIVFQSSKRMGESFPAPPYDQYTNTADGKTVLEVLNPSAGVYVPIKLHAENETAKLHVANTNVNEWSNLKRREAREMFKNEEPLILRLMPYIVLITFCASMAIVAVIAFQEMPKTLQTMSSVADKLYQAAVVINGGNVAIGAGAAPKI